LVSKFDAYTSGVYPDEEETEKTTQLLVDKFTELYLQSVDQQISKELFRKLPSCLDPIDEPELQKAFDADCRAMTLRVAQFHDKNLNENYVDDINARNFVDFLKSTPIVLCFDSLDVENNSSLSSSLLRPMADSLIRIYGLQVGVEIPQHAYLEDFKYELENIYRERHPENVLKRDEIDDLSDCVLEVKNDTIAQVLKKPVENEHFSNFLKARPLEVAERRRVSSDNSEITHEVISMYNVAQGGCRLFPDETVNTARFLTNLLESSRAEKPNKRTRLSIILEEIPNLVNELETVMREDMMELISAPTQVPTDEHEDIVPSLPLDNSADRSNVSVLPAERQQSVNSMLKRVFSDDEGEMVDVSDKVRSSILMYSSLQSSAHSSFDEEMNEEEVHQAGKLVETASLKDDNYVSLASRMKTIQEDRALKTNRDFYEQPRMSDENSGQYYVMNNDTNPEDPLIQKPKKQSLNIILTKRNMSCCVAMSLLILISLVIVIIFVSMK